MLLLDRIFISEPAVSIVLMTLAELPLKAIVLVPAVSLPC